MSLAPAGADVISWLKFVRHPHNNCFQAALEKAAATVSATARSHTQGTAQVRPDQPISPHYCMLALAAPCSMLSTIGPDAIPRLITHAPLSCGALSPALRPSELMIRGIRLAMVHQPIIVSVGSRMATSCRGWTRTICMVTSTSKKGSRENGRVWRGGPPAIGRCCANTLDRHAVSVGLKFEKKKKLSVCETSTRILS